MSAHAIGETRGAVVTAARLQNGDGRTAMVRPSEGFSSYQLPINGAPGTAQLVKNVTTLDRSDVRYIARVYGIVHAGVADSTGARDAHDLPRTAD